jgi:hypothetical protein
MKVGDTVRNIAADVVGVVVEIEGETVYLEQENGAEVDFARSKLVLDGEYQERHGSKVLDDEASHANDPIYDDVMSNLYPATVKLGQAQHASVKGAVGVAPRLWNDLTSLQKLNAISVATDVPVQDWIKANNPGAGTRLGPLQLEILARRAAK